VSWETQGCQIRNHTKRACRAHGKF
jgi:hypothetical protein